MITKQKANYINHIALVLDASGSMDHLKRHVIRVADEQIRHLAEKSKAMDQETRVSVYTFDYPHNIQCLIFDKDVLRLPSIASLYAPDGATALRDAIGKSIEDLQKTATMYGDHSFLVYVITDGAENQSRAYDTFNLHRLIERLPDNWTLGGFVPDRRGMDALESYGFAPGNVIIWETSEKGMKDVGLQIQHTTAQYMSMRSQGVRSTKSLFTMTPVSSAVVKGTLASLHPGQFRVFDVYGDFAIAPFVEAATGRAYRSGEAYYQLMKPETIQASKDIALLGKDHRLYVGKEARSLMGLPDYEVRVNPAFNPDFTVFVQSTSVNRKLIAGTKLVVRS